MIKQEMIKLGKYRHFKGDLYQVLHCARHSETDEWFVVYQPLYKQNNGDDDADIWIRPLTMFTEIIDRDGKTFQRFTYLSEN